MFFFKRKKKAEEKKVAEQAQHQSSEAPIEDQSTDTETADLVDTTATHESPSPVAAESSSPAPSEEATEIEPAAPEAPSAEAIPAPSAPEDTVAATEPASPEADTPAKKSGFFSRIKKGLSKTSANFSDGIASIFLGKKQIDDDLLEELETQLLLADVGMKTTLEIIDNLTERVGRKELKDPQALHAALKELLANQLNTAESTLNIDSSDGPYIILVVGVNGVGKTTTIGKLSKQFQAQGKSVMLAAGDTFRAAAVEQLQVWGERNDIPVIAQHTGADSASVIFDAVEAAKARKTDILIADTAGRLHNKSNLMEELSKVVRVMKKLEANAPHEVLLVLDAGTGQNAISQTKLFSEAVDVSGIALTKLDGTAKGGIIFALNKEFDIPVRFIGVGEGVDDLQPFEAQSFIDAIFEK